MSACPACGRPFHSEDVVTSRLGQILHSQCIERWQEGAEGNDDPASFPTD